MRIIEWMCGRGKEKLLPPVYKIRFVFYNSNFTPSIRLQVPETQLKPRTNFENFRPPPPDHCT